MAKIAHLAVLMSILICFTSCSIIDVKRVVEVSRTVKVHYYDGSVKEYDTANGKSIDIRVEMISEKGKRIVGLFDKDGIQYGSEDGIIRTNHGCPEDLYVRYCDAKTELVGRIHNEEDPIEVPYYYPQKYSYSLNYNPNQNDKEMLSSLKCNPYAKVTITVEFMLIGDGGKHRNHFTSYIQVGQETVASIDEIKAYSEWTKCSMSATITGLQLLKNDGTFVFGFRTGYGYEDYLMKNVQCRIDVDYNETAEIVK